MCCSALCLWRLCHYPPTAAAENFLGPEPNFCFSSVSDTSLLLLPSGTTPREGESLHRVVKTEMRRLFWLQHLPKTVCAVSGCTQVQPLEHCSQQRDLSLSLTGESKGNRLCRRSRAFSPISPACTHKHRPRSLFHALSQLRCDCKQEGISLRGQAAGKAAAHGCGSCWCLLLWLSQSSFPLPYPSLLGWFHPLSQRPPHCHAPHCFPGSISITGKSQDMSTWEGGNGAVDHL